MIFESRYKVTKDIYKEYVYKVLCRDLILNGILIVLLSIFLCANLWGSNVSITLFLVTFFVSIFCIIFVPIVSLKSLMKLDKKLTGDKEHPETIVTFSDKITLIEGEQKITIEYSQIEKYYRLKSFSILMFSKQNGIMFDENNFTKGNKEDFESFIIQKCNKVKKVIKR